MLKDEVRRVKREYLTKLEVTEGLPPSVNHGGDGEADAEHHRDRTGARQDPAHHRHRVHPGT